ncbi:MAG TPA: lysylphosphatidylglycerol synthase transmembrane domain-containing protein [Candidatus Limnocylindrales bacterium]|nr:lysylphosphatidylglycerol synthase transmembrane domain-containing protein [Candidatus Limnocylindrales bacterium]
MRNQLPAELPPPAQPPAGSELLGRLRDPRTLISFAILGVLLIAILTHVQLDYQQTLRAITQTNLLVYAAAIVIFYFSFVVRAVRWEVLLRNSGEESHFGGLFHIIILAWFANCVLPAKMGDFYRAYLLRRRTTISASHGLGTIVSERIIDFVILMTLLIISGLISFRTVPHRYLAAFIVGIAIALALVVGLIGLRFTGGRVSRLLPARFQGQVARFKGGLLNAFRQNLPLLVSLTVLVWLAESSRLYLVIQALPLHVALNPAEIMFIALVASLLTTIPALPGGLVLVEGGIIAVLVSFGLTPSQGLSVAILDRLISYWSLIVVGVVVFLMTRER